MNCSDEFSLKDLLLFLVNFTVDLLFPVLPYFILFIFIFSSFSEPCKLFKSFIALFKILLLFCIEVILILLFFDISFFEFLKEFSKSKILMGSSLYSSLLNLNIFSSLIVDSLKYFLLFKIFELISSDKLFSKSSLSPVIKF